MLCLALLGQHLLHLLDPLLDPLPQALVLLQLTWPVLVLLVSLVPFSPLSLLEQSMVM